MAKKNGEENQRNKSIAINRKARHEYIFEEFFEAGLALTGTEVKSLRAGRVNMIDAFASIMNGEAWLKNLGISVWEQGSIFNHEPTRPRKMLLHKSEIRKLLEKTKEKGLTLIPTRLYFKNGRVKVEIAVSRGKKLYDKREAEAAKSAKLDVDRAVREAAKG